MAVFESKTTFVRVASKEVFGEERKIAPPSPEDAEFPLKVESEMEIVMKGVEVEREEWMDSPPPFIEDVAVLSIIITFSNVIDCGIEEEEKFKYTDPVVLIVTSSITTPQESSYPLVKSQRCSIGEFTLPPSTVTFLNSNEEEERDKRGENVKDC